MGAQDGVTQKVAFEDRSNMRKLYSKAWQYLGKLHPDKGNIKSGYWGGIGMGWADIDQDQEARTTEQKD